MTNARTVKSAREKKAAELRAQAARKEARRRTLLVSVVVAVVVLLAVGITVVVRQAQHDTAVADRVRARRRPRATCSPTGASSA